MKQTLEGVLKYLRKNYCSYWIILGIDTAIAVLCTWIAYIGIYSMTGISVRTDVFAKIIGISFISSILASYIFLTYRNTIRFSQLKDLWRLMGSASLKTICMVIAIWIFIPQIGLANSQRIIFVLFDGMLTFIAMAGFRIQLILIYEFLLNQMNKKNERILIYGKDDKSVALQVRLMNSRHFKVVGFYVYDTSASILRVAGFPVYSFKNEEDFKRQMHKHCIQSILFARYEDTREEENRLLQYCKKNKIRTLIAPSISEADKYGNFHQWVRPIKIEDLLGRPEISINIQEVAAEFRDKVIMVTGAAGSIGSELCRQLAQMGIRKLIMFDSAETPLHNVRLEFEKKYPNLDFVPIIGDVRVIERLRMVFETYHPQIIFHAAAYKHVPLM